jgi:hypothetical protein
MLARFSQHFVRITWHLRALYLILVALIIVSGRTMTTVGS